MDVVLEPDLSLHPYLTSYWPCGLRQLSWCFEVYRASQGSIQLQVVLGLSNGKD